MNIEALRLLVAKGLSAADILEIDEALHSGAAKSTGAERQARYRARKAECSVTSDVTRDGNAVDSTPFPSPPKENNQTPPTHTPEYILPARKGSDFPMLDCTDSVTWRDFLKNRKAKTLPNTATAHAKLCRDLQKWSEETGWPPGEVFAACVAKGWGAIYDPRDKENGKSKQSRNSNDGMGVTERAARQAMHEISGGKGSFADNRGEIPARDFAGSNRVIDAVPDAMRSIGYAGS